MTATHLLAGALEELAHTRRTPVSHTRVKPNRHRHHPYGFQPLRDQHRRAVCARTAHLPMYISTKSEPEQ